MRKSDTTTNGQTGRKTHVIVGDGITALAFFQAAAERDVDEIIIIGQSASQLGRGAAYAKGEAGTPWRYAYLLNSPADDIDPTFAAWLADRWPQVVERMEGRAPNWLAAAAPLVAAGDVFGVNAPREFYGDFMEEQAAGCAAACAARGVAVTRVDDVAVGVDVGQDRVQVRTRGGHVLEAQSVDIAPGGPSTMRIEGDDGPFAAPSVFGHEARIAEFIRAGAEIFCIGGNAAMLDVLRLCQSLIPEDALRFVACAPDGEVPAPLVPRMPRVLTQPLLSTGHESAESFLVEVRREIDAALARGEEMREIRAGFRAHFLTHPLSGYLSDVAEARKIPGRLRLWLRGGTRDTIFDMHRLVSERRAHLIKGWVAHVAHGADGAEVVIRDAAGAERRHKTGFVVNCAGAGPNSSYDPVTQDLLDQGVLSRNATGGGLVVGQGCRTVVPAIRYLSPAVSEIGDDVIAMPLYDAHMLRSYVARAYCV